MPSTQKLLRYKNTSLSTPKKYGLFIHPSVPATILAVFHLRSQFVEDGRVVMTCLLLSSLPSSFHRMLHQWHSTVGYIIRCGRQQSRNSFHGSFRQATLRCSSRVESALLLPTDVSHRFRFLGCSPMPTLVALFRRGCLSECLRLIQIMLAF